MLKRVNTDLMAGLSGLLVFAIFWFARSESWRPSSSVWPDSILAAIAFFSVILLIKAVIVRDVFEIFDEGSRARMLMGGGALVVWALGVHYVGFLVTSVVMFVALCWAVTRSEQQTSPDAATAMTPTKAALWLAFILLEIGLLYAVFTLALLVPLPKGIAI